ncbi:MAG: hypothetical protein ACT4NP_20010 [Pseudonocardiales bacterium]
MSDHERWAELADHYDSHDTTDEMKGGRWETDVTPEPMITTALRLSQRLAILRDEAPWAWDEAQCVDPGDPRTGAHGWCTAAA